MVALFIHCDFTLTSWYVIATYLSEICSRANQRDYFWATLAIYGIPLVARWVRTLYNSNFATLPGSVELLSEDLVQITVKTPSNLIWSPGQHFFIRFLDSGLGLHALTSHPFTVASLPDDGAVKFVFRAHGGVTRVIARKAENKISLVTSVILDGPYGGIPADLNAFDKVLLLSGGTGESPLAFLQDHSCLYLSTRLYSGTSRHEETGPPLENRRSWSQA
jgi:predicted ferric reductase